MDFNYVISIKATKDFRGKACEEWRYAGIDKGPHGSGYPDWFSSVYGAERFENIESAKERFEESREFLFGTYFKPENYDISTLGIRKIVYQKVATLQIPKNKLMNIQE